MQSVTHRRRLTNWMFAIAAALAVFAIFTIHPAEADPLGAGGLGLGFILVGGITLDVFNTDAFSMRQLTAAILNLPYVPNRLGQLGIFVESGISTKDAMLERKNGKLYLVPSQSRGGPAHQNEREKRSMIPVSTIHLPVEDRILADELVGVRAFGTENELEGVWEKVTERLATADRSIQATLEYQRLGAVKGVVYDADGTTVLYNLFTLFGIQQTGPFEFPFSSINNNNYKSGIIRKKCSQVIRSIEDSLGATPYTMIMCLCASDFFDDLVDNPETRDAYQRFMDGQPLFDRSARRSFFYGGIWFEEYRGKVGNVDYVAGGEAHFFPIGPDLFKTNYAPANVISAIGTIGLPTYAKATPDPKDRWVDLDIQSNPLCYCTRPEALKKGVKA